MQYQHQFFEKSAERWPARVAIDDHGDRITYGELERRSNQIAWLLMDCGVMPNERVCIYTAKNANGYAAILGTLKAGGAWVPLSPAFPPERMKFLLASIRPKVVVVDQSTLSAALQLRSPDIAILCLGIDMRMDGVLGEHSLHGMPVAQPSLEGRSPEDLAYIIFTSGSTGNPKGVMVQHRSTAMFLQACAGFFNIADGSRFAHFSEFTFDPSIFDIFHCWQTGGVLVPFNRRAYRIDPGLFLKDQAVNVLFTLPSVIDSVRATGYMEDSALESVEHLLFTGEPLGVNLVQCWYERFPNSTLYNMYGTTETAIVSHWCVLPKNLDKDDHVPVGRVLPGMRVYLMDGDRLCKEGEAGESVVYGSQLSCGYWASENQTEASFIDNPIDTDLPQKMYRSGDILTVDATGHYYYCGRTDSMVKVRGHRVELLEIEGQLRLHEDVLDVAVVSHGGDKSTYDTHLTAYVCLSSTRECDLKLFLRERIPSYMVPSRITIQNEDLPRLPNGKVDRKKLAALARDTFNKNYES